MKLRHLDEDNARRKAVARRYIDGITNPLVSVPHVKDFDSNVFHIFPVMCPRRNELQEYLADNGVQTIIHYPVPPHKQECYREWNSLSFPVTEKIHNEELSLPISPVITDEEVGEVIRLVNSFK